MNNEIQTLLDLLRYSIQRNPHGDLLRYKKAGVWTSITGLDFLERVRNAAIGLHDLGIRKKDCVVLLAENGPLWTLCDFAILANGAINVPIYTTQSTVQIEYILRESDPGIILLSSKQRERIRGVLELFPSLKPVIIDITEAEAEFDTLQNLEKRGAQISTAEPDLFDRLTSEIGPGDLASIIYTSGTTGEPKGAMLTHYNLVTNAIASGDHLEIEPGNTMLSFLPLSHIFERLVLYLCFYCGVQINYVTGLDTIVSEMREVRPTLVTTVPRMLESILIRMQKNAAQSSRLRQRLFNWSLTIARTQASMIEQNGRVSIPLRIKHTIADILVYRKIRAAVGGRIWRMVSGGSALNPELAMLFTGAGVPILQGYGLTETSPVIAVNTLKNNRFGTVGNPIPDVEVIIAPDGEILSRGPHIFKGYFNKPAESSEAFIADDRGGDPWFKTGDIGILDEHGFLKITDRKKDLIKTTSGKIIAPQYIEGLLSQSEFIEHVFIIGNNRKYLSALVVPDFETVSTWALEQGIDCQDRKDLVNDSRVVKKIRSEINRMTSGLADYEKVKRISLLPQDFTIEAGELTPTLKMRRRIVEEKYLDLIESMYAGGTDN